MPNIAEIALLGRASNGVFIERERVAGLIIDRMGT